MSSIAVYAGCAAGTSIDIFELDLETGDLKPQDQHRTDGQVQWLATNPGSGSASGADSDVLYAAVRTDPATVATFRAGNRLDPAGTGTLAAPMAYLSTDGTGRHLLAASYNDDLVTVSGIDDGVAAGPLTSRVVPGRHAHTVVASPDNQQVYATALGDDVVVWWTFDEATGTLSDGGRVHTSAGSGPRHLRFSASGEHVYVLNEMAGTVVVYARDSSDGSLTEVQVSSSIDHRLQLVPGRVRDGSGPAPGPDAIWCAELRLTPDNRFLYTTERSSSTIAVFAVDQNTGQLSYLHAVETETQPRGMNITPDGRFLLACGEVSNALSVYRIEPDGGLRFLNSYACSEGPRCIEFS
ncbi:lactonase family protein [Arthrobacter castelli]|uniref:lactonase family protein n=1 Tax=Arthrobacter castelli TaxID=271431 RepID=UPI000420EAB3|nr:beta-propeller fold lactonase family protein [Arthrobacter castelli]